MRMRAFNPMLLTIAIASFLLSPSPSSLAAGASSGAAFMPFALGGVHTQNEKSPAYLEEVSEPRYVVEVSSIPKKKGEEEGGSGVSSPAAPSSSSSAAAAAKKAAAKKPKRTVSLADRAGRAFECSIPAPVDDDDDDEEEALEGGGSGSGSGSGSEQPSPVALLRSLEGTCLYRIEDSWWTFELCFERHVRQFHREGPGGVAAEFWLGKWGGSGGGGGGGGRGSAASAVASSSSSTSPLAPPSFYNASISGDRSAAAAPHLGGEASFVSSVYGGGDPCDLLNGKPRRTEVRFVCHEQPPPTQPPLKPEGGGSSQQQQQPPPPLVQPPPNVILSAKEHSTCSYEVVVGVDALCRHRGFKASEPTTATIECRPLVA